MADIELVIKIPKYVYNTIVANDGYIADCDNEKVGMAIINGTPLPKGHGDLKDMGNLKYVFDLTRDNPVFYSGKDIELAIKSMTTIIEADNTESEEE